MYETEANLVWLQELLDRTLARANPHLTSIVSSERRLTARQVTRYLQRTKYVAFATVNERGPPRVAPLDGVFIRGRFTVSTSGRAARLRDLRANPACSATHMLGDDVGITVHGHATILEHGDPGVDEIEPVWREIYGSSPFEWGEGVRLHAASSRPQCGRMPSTPELFSEWLELARVFSPSDRAGDDQKDHDGNRRDTYQQEEPAKRCGHFCPLPTLTGWLHRTGSAERRDLAGPRKAKPQQ